METPRSSAAPALLHRHPRPLSRDTVAVIGDLLPLCDFSSVLIAAYFATVFYIAGLPPEAGQLFPMETVGRAALAAAVIAPLVLCDRVFVSFASGGQTANLVRCYLVRFALFIGIVLALGVAARFLPGLPLPLLVFWFAASLLGTALIRALLVGALRRLERDGRLSERIAVVGEGEEAERLVAELAQQRPGRVAVLGPYAEAPMNGGASVADLLERGKSEPVDWILLAPPAGTSAEAEAALVHQLKSLAVPLARHRPELGPERAIPGSLQAATEAVVPDWLRALLGPLLLPLGRGLKHLVTAPPPLTLAVDDCDMDGFVATAQRFGTETFGYAVTPNADHLIRLHQDPAFRRLYERASYVLLDSRFLSHCLRLSRGQRLPVCTGSDLTAHLLGAATRHDDVLVMIGGSSVQAERLRQTRGLTALHHHNPPMGFIHDPEALETCLQFIEAHSPFRYCLLAVGAPQQELVAEHLLTRGRARGLALCIGASLNFITGDERRAPKWMQEAGLEWLFRLRQSPRRLGRRYLVRGPQVFALLRNTRIHLRPVRQPAPRVWEVIPQNVPALSGSAASPGS